MTFDRKAYMKEYNRKYYLANREALIEYAREYQKQHPRQAKEAKRRYREVHRDNCSEATRNWQKRNAMKVKEINRRYRERNPEKTIAWSKARSVSLSEKCEECGSTENLEHHHPDYSKPLFTITLCRSCHQRKRRLDYVHIS